MPASPSASVAPASVTTLSVPTFLFANVAVPPDRLTSSPDTSPATERVSTVALTLPSYTLLLAVKLPVMPLAVMSAFAVPTEVRA